MAGEGSGERFKAVERIFRYQTKEARRRKAESSPRLPDAFGEMFGGAESR